MTSPKNSLPIVDTHQHIWDLNRFRLPWIEQAPSELQRSWYMSDYLDATEGLNVVMAVYMEVDLQPSQQAEEAAYITELCEQDDNPTKALVISGRPASEGFAAYIKRFRDNPFIKGLRQVLHVDSTPPGTCLQPDFVRGVQLLENLGYCFDLCMRVDELKDACRLVELCPGTRFILDHCGNVRFESADHTQWKRDMDSLAQYANVMCKVSGVADSATRENWTPDELAPVINHVLDTFGPDRVMFAANWPVCTSGTTFRKWVEALKSVVRERPGEHQRKLFHDNAVNYYELQTSTTT